MIIRACTIPYFHTAPTLTEPFVTTQIRKNRIRSEKKTEINCENIIEKMHLKSHFIESIKKSLAASCGFKYCLKIDISNFYNSIYTHSITWAVCGKKNAKQMHLYNASKGKKGTPPSPEYSIADTLDKYTRDLKNNETNGILVGPFSSRIFSEIILAGIDKRLIKEKLIFKRYVDDYKFYFRTEAEAVLKLSLIERILNEFNLNINASKTEILQFPFDNIEHIKYLFETAYEREGVFGILNQAGLLHNAGQKGAYKYALKMITGYKIKSEEIDVILPLLVNIMLLNPKYCNYIDKQLKENIEAVGRENIEKVINSELESNLKNNLEQEVLVFLFLIRELKLGIDSRSIIDIIKMQNDFSCIIALDIVNNHNYLINDYLENKVVIENVINELMNSLADYDYKNEHWLLLYESELHDFFCGKFSYPEKDKFFKKMKELNISFYRQM